MIKICFVCLGNICRSPMAEFIMKDKVNKLGLSNEFYIASRATSYEESGNDIYYPAKKILEEMNIPFDKHKATRLEKNDYSKFDYFVCMEQSNINRVLQIFGDDPENKIEKLLNIDIADPWYTGDFVTTYDELVQGIDILIENKKKFL